MLWVPVLGAILLWAPPPAPALRTLQRGNSFQIVPKPCSVNSVEGTCMFVWQCIQSEGKHIGMCVDTFMFGSCCSHNLSQNAVLSSSEPDVLFSAPASSATGNKYHNVYTVRPTHGPNSSSYTTTSHKFKPTYNKTQLSTSHKFTARPQGTNQLVANSRPNFISSGSSSSAKYPSRPKPYKPYNGYSSPSPKPYDKHSGESSEKTSKPSDLPEHRPHTEVTTRPPHTNQTNWVSKSPPAGHSGSPSSSSSQTGMWSSSKLPATTSWQASSTEPGFVTRPRPSNHRPRPPPRLRPTRRPAITTTPVNPAPTPTSTSTTSSTTAEIPTQMPSTTTSTTTTMTPSTTEGNELEATSTISSVSAYNKEKPGQCGVSALYPRPEMRIVGGKNAPFGGWPWQVSVRRTSFFGFSSTHRCGGAVLNERWIATAGHCVDDLLTSQIRIRVGEYDFSSVQEPHPYIERSVTRKVVHPKYNFFTYEYDLALVQLETALTFAPHIAPICLPASDDLLIGENATVTGWGRLSEGGTLPSVLQQVSVPIVSNDQCKSMFLRAGRHEFIPEIFLCAGYQTGGQDSCQGDSGGPLQVRGKDGRYFLAGIISWGIGCAEANLPGVCTRISKFVHWILDNVT